MFYVYLFQFDDEEEYINEIHVGMMNVAANLIDTPTSPKQVCQLIIFV